MPQIIWRKTPAYPFNHNANEKYVVAVSGKGCFRYAILFVVLLLSATLQADDINNDLLSFNIPQQRADLALTLFAEQAGVTLLFPYEVVKEKTANRLVGKYRTEEAIQILLKGTGLAPMFSDHYVLNIKTGEKRESDMKKSSIFAGTAAFLASVFSSPHVVAQEAGESEARDATIEVITVTARFREENSQDIGASISAISGKTLAERNITDVDELARSVAGLANLKSQPNTNDISIRGVTNGFGGADFATSAQIGLYIDDVAVASPQFQRDFNFFDFNRIEVIRGPQPTLFGEGSVGGTLRYFSTDPELDGPIISGFAHGRLESIADGGLAYRAENAASLVLVPGKLAVRAVGYHVKDEGFIDNPTAGSDDINDFKSSGGRVVVLAEPTDKLQIRASAFISRDDIGEFTQIDPGSNPDDLTFSGAPVIGDTSDDFDLYSGKISYDFGPVTATSITGYYKHKSVNSAYSGPNTFGFSLFTVGIDPLVLDANDNSERNFSQEFRFVSDFDGPLSFTSGLYYKDIKRSADGQLIGPDFESITTPSTTILLTSLLETDVREYSGFMELTYAATDRLRLIGGVRYVDENLDRTLVRNRIVNFILENAPYSAANPLDFVDPVDVLNAAGFGSTFEFKLNKWLPRAGIEFDLNDDVLVYASIAKGARNGGTNQPLSALTNSGGDPDLFHDALIFNSDQVVSAEAGAKSVLFNGALIANVAAFYTKYKDTQIFAAVPTAAAVNGPDERILGLELDTSYYPTRDLSVFFNALIMDAEFTEDFQSVTAFPTTIFDGNKPINTPKLSFAAGYDYSRPVRLAGTDLKLFSNATLQYIGSRYNSSENYPSTKLGNLTTVNASLGLEGDTWRVSIFATNLLNEIEVQQAIFSGPGVFLNSDGRLDSPITAAYVNRPRAIGVDLTIYY